jgi:hypothetical protein
MTLSKHNKFVKTDERRCSNCINAHKIDDEYDKMYACDAEEYDIEHLTCFVPKEE